MKTSNTPGCSNIAGPVNGKMLEPKINNPIALLFFSGEIAVTELFGEQPCQTPGQLPE